MVHLKLFVLTAYIVYSRFLKFYSSCASNGALADKSLPKVLALQSISSRILADGARTDMVFVCSHVINC